MAAAKTHPHVEMPSEDDLHRLVDGMHPQHTELYLMAHRLVIEAVPGVRFSVDCSDGAIGYGSRQFGYDGWGMAALAPYKGWVSLAFLRGTELEDPDGLLEGTGALVRHVKLKSADDLAHRRDALRRLVKAAAGLANSDR